jgi:hypothetical protein
MKLLGEVEQSYITKAPGMLRSFNISSLHFAGSVTTGWGGGGPTFNLSDRLPSCYYTVGKELGIASIFKMHGAFISRSLKLLQQALQIYNVK